MENKPSLNKSIEQETLDKKLAKLEKRVPTLEGVVQEQQELKLKNDYNENFGKPKLLKSREKLFNNSKKFL